MHMVIAHIQDPRLLVVSTNRWPMAGQVTSALERAGFQVAVICPIDSPVHQLRKLAARFPYRSRNPSVSIKSAIAEWLPNILVCADDVALHTLRSLSFEAAQNLSDENVRLLDLIQLSFGDPHSYVITRSKNSVLSLALSLGINCPQTTVLGDNRGCAEKAPKFVFPAMMKTDDAWGGLGVRLVNYRSGLWAAIAELSCRTTGQGK